MNKDNNGSIIVNISQVHFGPGEPKM